MARLVIKQRKASTVKVVHVIRHGEAKGTEQGKQKWGVYFDSIKAGDENVWTCMYLYIYIYLEYLLRYIAIIYIYYI